MPYIGEIVVNDLPVGGTPALADKVMLIDNATGDLKLFTAEALGSVVPVRDGITDEIKQALLQLAQKVAYVDANGEDYYDDLYHALYPGNLVAISAVYDSTHQALVGDSLDSLKPYLTVTAVYDDSSTMIVTNYTLSGSLSVAGSNIITVTYTEGNQTAISQVSVTALGVVSISAVFTQGANVIYDTDSLETLEQYLVVTANYSDGTSATVTAYSLSGTLTEGTSTITVTYEGLTDTFTVTVTGYLPGIYQAVEYIASSGTQYIETSVLSQVPMKMEAKSRPLANDIAPVIGAHNSSVAKSRFFLLGYPYANLPSEGTGGTRMRASCRFSDDTPGNLGAGSWLGITTIIDTSTDCITETEITQNGSGTTRKFTSNGSTVTANGNMPTTGYPIKLMIKPGSGTPVAMRVYYCKLYAEDSLLFDGIPCYRKSDSVAGIFDAVSRTFLTNAGTGTFSVGSDV